MSKHGKLNRFWQRVQHRIRQWQAISVHHVSLIIFLALFLITAILPSTAHIAVNTSADNFRNTENLVEQGRVLYESQQFSDAVKILQQAVRNYAASGDKLT